MIPIDTSNDINATVISSMVKYLSCYPGVVSLVSGFSGLSDET